MITATLGGDFLSSFPFFCVFTLNLKFLELGSSVEFGNEKSGVMVRRFVCNDELYRTEVSFIF